MDKLGGQISFSYTSNACHRRYLFNRNYILLFK